MGGRNYNPSIRCVFPIGDETTVGAGPVMCGRPATRCLFCDEHGRGAPPTHAAELAEREAFATRALADAGVITAAAPSMDEAREAREAREEISRLRITARALRNFIVEMDPRNATALYEMVADAFAAATGYWPPGRSMAAPMYRSEKDDAKATAAWRPFVDKWHEDRFDRVLGTAAVAGLATEPVGRMMAAPVRCDACGLWDSADVHCCRVPVESRAEEEPSR